MFQGGFIAKNCKLFGSIAAEGEPVKLELITEILPKDKNECQEFELEEGKRVSLVKLMLSNCIDFYGRITMYKLDILGSEVDG